MSHIEFEAGADDKALNLPEVSELVGERDGNGEEGLGVGADVGIGGKRGVEVGPSSFAGWDGEGLGPCWAPAGEPVNSREVCCRYRGWLGDCKRFKLLLTCCGYIVGGWGRNLAGSDIREEGVDM